VIMSNDLEGLNTAIAISRRTVRIMLQAVLGGIIAALIGMMLAAFGLIPTIVGALLQELIDATSILWALRAAFDGKERKR
ncbi:MAG: heavy metal translocating P-type ATPase, partial [Parascardovia denticolens]